MKSNSVFVSSLLAIILGVGVGCARKPDDAKISSDIQGKFSQDSGLATKQLTVQAEDGVVTLAGRVDNDAQREAAGRQAGSTPGVKTVINNLQVNSTAVKPPAAPPQAPPSVRASGASPDGKAKPVAGKKTSRGRLSDSSMAANNSPSDSNDKQTVTNDPPADTGSQPAPAADHVASQAPPPH